VTVPASAGQGAAVGGGGVAGDLAVLAAGPGVAALDLRDRALAALDGGDPREALTLVRRGRTVLAGARLGGGPDEAALLVAQAEIEEALDRFGDAAATARAAIALLGGEAGPGEGDHDTLLLWCQAQERQAGLERLAADFGAAAARLGRVLDVAAGAFGETSQAVVSAANALGVVGKYAGDFDAAQAAYARAMAAADAVAAGPLIRAGLLHNLGGLAHSRGDAAAGIPLAERGLALRTGALGAVHPDVAKDLNALGALYHLAGRYADAGQAYRRALVVFEDCYGPDHFEVAMTCANLAVLHADQGQFAAAEALGRRALRILEAVLGPADAEVGLTVLNLATAVAGQDRQAEAAALAEHAAAILTARLPAGHPHLDAAHETLEHLRSTS
jgi:tetratricopeptide (TPR) repeat protein